MQTTNRRGERYYESRGKAKTSNPKCFASKKQTSPRGVLIESLPDCYKLYGDPGSRVATVRRIKALNWVPSAIAIVLRRATELSAYSVTQTLAEGDSLVLYSPDTPSEKATAAMERPPGGPTPGLPRMFAYMTKCGAA